MQTDAGSGSMALPSNLSLGASSSRVSPNPGRTTNLLSLPVVLNSVAGGAPLQTLSQASGKRFKPLVASKRPVEAAAPVISADTPGVIVSHSTKVHKRPASKQPAISPYYLDFSSSCPPALVPITLPPSLSQRKRVQLWAVILSEVSDQDRVNCVLVSRTFRYAGLSRILTIAEFTEHPISCLQCTYLHRNVYLDILTVNV